MAFITTREIIDIVLMTLFIGFIFSRFFKRRQRHDEDPLAYYMKTQHNPLWEEIKYGAMIAAPAVVLHELAHKFVAMYFGATATLHAPIILYTIVLVMILLRFPLIFFVGGYVNHTALPAIQSAAVSFAGPLTNLVLAGIFWLMFKKDVLKKYNRELAMMAKLNLFLFVFNMIPIPGFDGFNFFKALLTAFGII